MLSQIKVLIKVRTHCTKNKYLKLDHINENIISQLGNFKSTHSKALSLGFKLFKMYGKIMLM